MLRFVNEPRIETDRLLLRPPLRRDHVAWARARAENRAFLSPWEPRWSRDHLTRSAFRERVAWARRSIRARRAYPLFIFLRDGGALIGAITLDHVRAGPAKTGMIGYWISEAHSRQGLMSEALRALCVHAFEKLEVSRLEANCLPENEASRALLARCGFHEEGLARAYLRIDGRWRDHVLHARLRPDRDGG